MSTALRDHLEAVGRLLELSLASESAGFREYADHQRAVVLERLDVSATVAQTNARIVEDYVNAIAALSLTRRAVVIARGRE